MINSIHELEQRIEADKKAATSQEDMMMRAEKMWDEMSPDVQDAMKTTLRVAIDGVVKRVNHIIDTYHPDTEWMLHFYYYREYGFHDKPILDTIIKKMHKGGNENG